MTHEVCGERVASQGDPSEAAASGGYTDRSAIGPYLAPFFVGREASEGAAAPAAIPADASLRCTIS